MLYLGVKQIALQKSFCGMNKTIWTSAVSKNENKNRSTPSSQSMLYSIVYFDKPSGGLREQRSLSASRSFTITRSNKNNDSEIISKFAFGTNHNGLTKSPSAFANGISGSWNHEKIYHKRSRVAQKGSVGDRRLGGTAEQRFFSESRVHWNNRSRRTDANIEQSGFETLLEWAFVGDDPQQTFTANKHEERIDQLRTLFR
ncbi:hypothetical protein AB6A40_002053 [Gnathostoma spinigerum]|uniref:Uncharacterized protein n=1 Tax=Gnathostoma spinigerum TaxID=75299 RepID=A0ABD6E5N1_9BILA